MENLKNGASHHVEQLQVYMLSWDKNFINQEDYQYSLIASVVLMAIILHHQVIHASPLNFWSMNAGIAGNKSSDISHQRT